MDILIQTLLVGAAVAYFIEFVTSLTDLVSPRVIKLVFTAPLSYFGCWLFDIVGFPLIVCGLAAGFVAGTLSILVNRPVVMNNYNRR